MLKILAAGLWACLVAIGASYGAITWMTGAVTSPATKETTATNGLESHKLDQLTVPMIRDGKVEGYVLAKLAFTADAKSEHGMSVDSTAFVTDEAFREVYSNGQIDFSKMEKYDLGRLSDAIKSNVNQRLGTALVHDILFLEINYIDKASLKSSGAG